MATTDPTANRAPPPWAVALAGALSLAAAMGIGRFAFTPLLPLMMREGLLDVGAGGWLAAANYVGYFVGALTAARLPLGARALGLLALLATAALTAAMALPVAAAWLPLRLAAGVASAWAFVATSVWCLGALARQGAGTWSGAVYAGVGAGIALAGLHALLAATLGTTSPALWLQLAGVALLLALAVGAVLARLPPSGASAAAAGSAPAAPSSTTRGLVICYGLMGFGYILPATYLPVLARTVVDDPRWFGLAWPVFGLTAALSTLAARRWLQPGRRLRLWAACQALMGAGTLLPGLWLAGWTVALAAGLVGGTFMVITLAGVQEMRDRAQGPQATAAVGRLTAAFAAGQIAGPVASSLLLYLPGWREHALKLALFAAALALLASAAWLATQARIPRLSKEPTHVH
jgi:MFS family permease